MTNVSFDVNKCQTNIFFNKLKFNNFTIGSVTDHSALNHRHSKTTKTTAAALKATN